MFVISVAAELAGVHPQTLRIYERKGLVDPGRTTGGSRRYSEIDIERVRRIQDLTAAGLNLEGVRRVIELEEEVRRLRAELEPTPGAGPRRRRADPPAVPPGPRAAVDVAGGVAGSGAAPPLTRSGAPGQATVAPSPAGAEGGEPLDQPRGLESGRSRRCGRRARRLASSMTSKRPLVRGSVNSSTWSTLITTPVY